MTNIDRLQIILAEGEGLTVEFKERIAKLDREIVAFANTIGGSVFLGIDDDGNPKGVQVSNRLKSQIQDIARNCDPSIKIKIITHAKEILEVFVEEGVDKPYRCTYGFFVRIGPSTQKLKRDEIVDFINQAGKIRYDEALNDKFNYPKDFSKTAFQEYLKKCGISVNASIEDLLISFNIADENNKNLTLTNAGVLFFAKEPQRFFPESYITCVRYKTQDRFSILDKKDFFGSPIEQIDNALTFIMRHISVGINYEYSPNLSPGQSKEVYDIPQIALREAVINAVVHRDYWYDSSHTYVHIYPNFVEIENPGGLYHGLTVDNLGKRSIRRNRLIADLLSRAHYIERVGSGFDKMNRSLKENQNPPLEISATNFFNIRFYHRVENEVILSLTNRQRILYQYIQSNTEITRRDAALVFG